MIIKDFKGVFTNGDQADLPEGFFSELKNVLSKNGQLVKTHGYGLEAILTPTLSGYGYTTKRIEYHGDYIIIILINGDNELSLLRITIKGE